MEFVVRMTGEPLYSSRFILKIWMREFWDEYNRENLYSRKIERIELKKIS